MRPKKGRIRKYDPTAITRVCRLCELEKPVEAFNPNRIMKNGYMNVESRCTACKRAAKYGITDAVVQEMLISQDFKCAICKMPLPEKYDIDHCHNANVVRGILCPACNVMLGYANDDVNTLQAAIDYLS